MNLKAMNMKKGFTRIWILGSVFWFVFPFFNFDDGSSMPVENAFQGSKVFKNGGPFSELYFADPIKIKKDIR